MRYPSTFVLIAALTAFSCGGSPSGPSGSAALNLRITDSPYSAAKAVLVTLSGARIHSDEAGWVDVDMVSNPITCDLKKLEGPDALLGTNPALPEGHFSQIRLVVESATIYDEASGGTACAPDPAGTSSPLEIPSGEVKINHAFELVDGTTTTIVLDFSGDESIKIHGTGNGRYIMTPVIRVVRKSSE